MELSLLRLSTLESILNRDVFDGKLMIDDDDVSCVSVICNCSDSTNSLLIVTCHTFGTVPTTPNSSGLRLLVIYSRYGRDVFDGQLMIHDD